MKFKKILGLSIPIVAATAIAIATPLVLTSCSNNTNSTDSSLTNIEESKQDYFSSVTNYNNLMQKAFDDDPIEINNGTSSKDEILKELQSDFNKMTSNDFKKDIELSIYYSTNMVNAPDYSDWKSSKISSTEKVLLQRTFSTFNCENVKYENGKLSWTLISNTFTQYGYKDEVNNDLTSNKGVIAEAVRVTSIKLEDANVKPEILEFKNTKNQDVYASAWVMDKYKKIIVEEKYEITKPNDNINVNDEYLNKYLTKNNKNMNQTVIANAGEFNIQNSATTYPLSNEMWGYTNPSNIGYQLMSYADGMSKHDLPAKIITYPAGKKLTIEPILSASLNKTFLRN